MENVNGVASNGEENSVPARPTAVNELPNLFLKGVVLRGNGTPFRHCFESLDGRLKPVKPFYSGLGILFGDPQECHVSF